ncbi:hypothetical protein AWV79_18915 [Cupriavidus sp. UYMMa02A]|nr:hypothetical protein AWV79_18915 [Cupriavidus sp. UYMMa02A]
MDKGSRGDEAERVNARHDARVRTLATRRAASAAAASSPDATRTARDRSRSLTTRAMVSRIDVFDGSRE